MAANNDVGYSWNLVKNLRVIIDTVVKNIQRKPSKKSRKRKKERNKYVFSYSERMSKIFRQLHNKRELDI